jgi:multicomponent Na+:H+ antiporter subunit B
MRSLILITTARLVTPLLVIFSLFLLLRGHNEPGGGFAGGLVAAAAFVLIAISHEPQAARRALRIEPQLLIGAGLLTAVAAALIGPFTGGALLEGRWVTVRLLLDTEVYLGTPLLFDIGVYLVVVGATLTMLLTLAEEE